MISYSKYILIILLFISNYKSLRAQNSEGINYGFGCKASVELLKVCHKSAWVNWRFAISGSLSYTKNISYDNYWMPQVHGDLVFMQGGVGTSDIDNLRDKGTIFNRLFKRKINMFLAGTFVPAFYGYKVNQNSDISRTYMGKPLYYFSDFTYPVLKNPFLAHLSLGTSIVYNFRANNIQRVASGYFSHKNTQFIYANDGPPFALWGILGDKKDRWFTGGGILSYYNNVFNPFNCFEVSYTKFTGWTKNSFETSCDLGLTEVSYRNPEEAKYNTSLVSVRFTNSISHNTVGLVYYDGFNFDIQHWIHYNLYMSHHVSPNPSKIGLILSGQKINTTF